MYNGLPPKALKPSETNLLTPRKVSASTSEATTCRRDASAPQLLILAYHRIASDGPDALRPWRIDPADFDQQLSHIKSLDCHVTTVEAWFAGRHQADVELPAWSLAITFDDAFRDFGTAAFPLLCKHDLIATVFVPTALVGGSADWDSAAGPPAALLDWTQIRDLKSLGISFGSHGCSHRALDQLSIVDVRSELEQSKRRLEDELKKEVTTIAYPYGLHNALVRANAVELGYSFGLGIQAGVCGACSDPFQLPRLEVGGSLTIAEFREEIDKILGGPSEVV